MRHLHSIDLTNIVSFKKARLKIEKAPLTFIYGRNFDADDEEGVTGNGTGKSLLISSVPNLCYSAPPTSRKKKAKKDLLYKKGAKIAIKMSDETGKHKLVQTAKGYEIEQDGSDLQFKRINDAEAHIHERIPLSEEEFYTTVFLATNRKFAMQAATDSERLDYFTKIFRFDFFDKLQGYFSKKNRTIKDDGIRMEVLEAQRLALKAKIKKAKASTDIVDLSELEAQKRELDDKIAKLNDRLFVLTKLQPDADALVSTFKRRDKLLAKHELEGDQTKRVRKLKDQRKALREWEEYDSELKAWRKGKEQYTERVDDLKKKVGDVKPKTLRADLKENEAALQSIEQEYRKWQRTHDQYERLALDAKKLKKAINGEKVSGSVEDVKSEIARCNITLKLKRLLDHDHSDDDSECPTCLSKIDLSSIRRAVKAAEKAKPALQDKLEALEAQAELKEVNRALKDLDHDPELLDGFDSDLSQTKARIQGLRTKMDALEQLETLEAKGYPKRPDEPEVKRPKRSLEEINDELEVISNVVELQETIDDTLKRSDFSKVTDKPLDTKAAAEAIALALAEDVEDLTSKQRKRQAKLSEVSTTLSELGAKQAELELYLRESKSTVKEMDKLAPSLATKKIVEGLFKFYSSKAERARAANTVCTLLEANLNQYRPLIFVEPFSFTVEATDTGISMMVDRGNGHKTDIRYLSAAEADCFSCLHLLSILPLIPDSRRFNMVFLDEPMCHAHPVTRAVFRDRFLPVLCSVVPHVFVVSQHDEDYIEGARKLLVIKEQGVSRLEDAETTN